MWLAPGSGAAACLPKVRAEKYARDADGSPCFLWEIICVDVDSGTGSVFSMQEMPHRGVVAAVSPLQHANELDCPLRPPTVGSPNFYPRHRVLQQKLCRGMPLPLQC